MNFKVIMLRGQARRVHAASFQLHRILEKANQCGVTGRTIAVGRGRARRGMKSEHWGRQGNFLG